MLTTASGREILNSLKSVKLQYILSTLLKERGYQAERPRLAQVLRERKGSWRVYPTFVKQVKSPLNVR